MLIWYECEYCNMKHNLKTSIWKCDQCKREICDNCTDYIPNQLLCNLCVLNKKLWSPKL